MGHGTRTQVKPGLYLTDTALCGQGLLVGNFGGLNFPHRQTQSGVVLVCHSISMGLAAW